MTLTAEMINLMAWGAFIVWVLFNGAMALKTEIQSGGSADAVLGICLQILLMCWMSAIALYLI